MITITHSWSLGATPNKRVEFLGAFICSHSKGDPHINQQPKDCILPTRFVALSASLPSALFSRASPRRPVHSLDRGASVFVIPWYLVFGNLPSCPGTLLTLLTCHSSCHLTCSGTKNNAPFLPKLLQINAFRTP